MIYYDLAVLFYILSFLLLIINFYFNKTILQTLQTIFTGLAVVANMAEILLHWQDMRMLLTYTVHDLLMFVSLSLAVVYLLINLRYKRPYVGFFLLPMVIIAGLASLFLRHGHASSSASLAVENMWLYIHIPLEIIGTAFFLTAFATGLMYFIMEKQLKQKKFGKIFDRFPSLATIDGLNSGSLFLGFAFYTAGALTAAGWMRFRIDSAVLDGSFYMKLFFAVLVWAVFAVIIFLKVKSRMNARQTALASIVGFISIMLVYAAVVLFIMRQP